MVTAGASSSLIGGVQGLVVTGVRHEYLGSVRVGIGNDQLIGDIAGALLAHDDGDGRRPRSPCASADQLLELGQLLEGRAVSQLHAADMEAV